MGIKTTEQCVKLHPIPTSVKELHEMVLVHEFNLEADIKIVHDRLSKQKKNIQDNPDWKLAMDRWRQAMYAKHALRKLIELSE